MASTAKKSPRGGNSLQFTISREQLIEGLESVAPSIAKKTTLPILASFLIESRDAGVRITGTDLDMSIATDVAADVDGNGSVTIPAQRLLAIAKALPPAPVRIRVAQDAKITIDCGRAHFTLLGLPADDFPQLPSISFNAGAINASELRGMVASTVFATSKEESRPILSGVLWRRSANSLRLVATDGHRMAVCDQKVKGSLGAPENLIIPPKALEQVARLFGDDDDVEMGVGDNHLAFRSPRTSICTRLIEGPYPDYERIIPKKSDREILVDRAAFVGAVRRCAIVASSATHRVVLDMSNGRIAISAMTPDAGDASDEIAAKITGPALKLAMNASFLLQILNAIGTDEVIMRAREDKGAVVLQSADEKRQAEALYLIMPMRVNE